MKRRSYGRDTGLTLRMLLTTGLLGLLYVVFAVVLFSVLNVGLAPMLLIVVGIAFFQYYTSDKLALAAAGAKVVERDEAPDLHDMVERLCAMADLPKPKIAVMDTPVPNAFATGRSPKHAAVCVTTGLWHRLEPKEIEGVLAHELSHIANRDVLMMTVASFFAMLAALLTRFGLYSGMFGGFGGGGNAATTTTTAPPVWLIDPRRLDRRLRDQLRPDPHALALPRVRGRPRLGADHGRARVPDERAPEDLVADDADPAAGPAPGRGDERVLHHPGAREDRSRRSSSWITRRSRSASPRSPRSPARWAVRSPRAVGLRDALFGRKKLSQPKDDRLFALSTAAVTLETELGLKTAGKAAVTYKPLSAGEFTSVDTDIESLLKAAARSSGSEIERKTDSFGYEWLIIHDKDLEDQVTAVHAVAQQMTEQGFGAQLLAAPFLFDGRPAPRLLDLRLQARHVLAVRPDRRRARSATTPTSSS